MQTFPPPIAQLAVVLLQVLTSWVIQEGVEEVKSVLGLEVVVEQEM